MARKIEITVCATVIAASVFFVGVAHSREVVEPLKVSPTAIHPSVGEILLEGRVLRVVPDGTSLTLQAERFTLASGRSGSIIPAKEKTVTFSPQSVRGAENISTQLENAYVQVVGPDDGAGAPLAAREILVLSKTATIASNPETNSPFPSAERLALGKKLLTEAELLLETPRTFAPANVLQGWASPTRGDEPDFAYRNYRMEIAKGYILLGDITEVSALIKRESFPGWEAQAWAEIGRFQAERGEKTAAKQSLKRAILSLQASPRSDSYRSDLYKADIQQSIVELAALLGDVVTAQEQIKQMYVNGVPPGIYPYQKYRAVPALAFALAGAGRLAEANQRVLEIPTKDIPFRVEAYIRMSQSLRQRGWINEAVQYAEKGWETASKILSPAAKSEAWARVGEAFGMLGYRKRARLAYRQAVGDLASVGEGASWSTSQNGKESTGVYTEAKPRFAMQVLESQARINDTDEAAKLLPRISAPDEESLKTYVYGYQARAWLALARSYAAQGRLEEAASALTHSGGAMSKTESPNLEMELMQMKIAQECNRSEEVSASAQAAQKAVQGVQGWAYRRAEAIAERADAALLLLQSTQPPLPQPEPLRPRIDEPNYAPSAIPSSKPIPNVRFVPGQETLLVCQGTPSVSYRIYWPKTKAAGQLKNVMLMIPAGGSAPILSIKLADEFGWAMIGLQKTTYSQGELAGAANAAIKDFEMRLKRPLIWRFAGFSAGGYAAAAVAQTRDDHCAGLFMMGSSWYFSGHTPKYPVVFLVGTQDFNRPNGERDFALVQKLGVPSLLISPNAGHTSGNASEQELAIRFLATHYAQP